MLLKNKKTGEIGEVGYLAITHNETLLQYLGTDLEIIGTIHENMELLEAKC